MAHLHSELPKKTGELNLAKQLISIPDDHLHTWFSLDYIPSVRDSDCLLWHEEAGVFVVEVKAVSLNMVEEFGLFNCRIRGRGTDESPQRQAYSAQEGLRRFLKPLMRTPPFLVSTVCWPRISRDAWKRNWDDALIGDLSERMIFEDDICAGPKALSDRLKRIWFAPPIRRGSDSAFVHRPTVLTDFNSAITRTATPIVAPSDLTRLRRIEEGISRETIAQVPLDSSVKVLYYGYPGTGKTFRLLQIAMFHVMKGRSVLFSCFNKVLAADLRRILVHSQRLKAAQGRLVVKDVFEILSEHAAARGITEIASGYDEWGQLIADDMKACEADLKTFDTILIDEAQDMQDWALSMLELHAVDGATFCVAAGSGQELYGDTGTWLERYRGVAKLIQLRRNFRNTLQVFRLAHVFFESKLDVRKIEKSLRSIKASSADQQQSFEFDRKEGRAPSILRLDNSPMDVLDESDSFFVHQQTEQMVAEYSRIITEQLERLSEDEMPIDLLVLVPSFKSIERDWALQAIQRTKNPFIDYTVDDNRRDIAQASMVRLCTFHSARGIEGHRVLLFGFHRIDDTAEKIGVDFNKLGYIALSRSIFELGIAVPGQCNSSVMSFVESALGRLAEMSGRGDR